MRHSRFCDDTWSAHCHPSDFVKGNAQGLCYQFKVCFCVCACVRASVCDCPKLEGLVIGQKLLLQATGCLNTI